MAKVVITKATAFTQDKIADAVGRALDTLGCDFNDKIDSVVIKPNLCYYWDYSTGETTDPRVVSGVIDWIKQRAGKDVQVVIAEADASAMRTKHVFRMLGYEKLSQEKNVRLVNLSEGKIVEREVRVRGEEFVLPVNRLLLDADLLVNVPKMKVHRALGFTCALKNMFGAIATARKYVYHDKLARVIVGINKIIETSIVLVDGVIAVGRTPRKLGVLMASDDVLAADFVVAKAMGYNPSGIGYLKLGMSEKVGDVNNLNVIENPIGVEDVAREFPRQNYFLKRLSWRMQLRMLRLYSKISKDVIPPILNDEG